VHASTANIAPCCRVILPVAVDRAQRQSLKPC
jgi:hypothetical protein